MIRTCTIFQVDSVSIETRFAQVTSGTTCVIQAAKAFSRDGITRTRLIYIDISVTLAWLTEFTLNSWLPIETRSATLTHFTSVSGLALTTDPCTIFRYLTRISKAEIRFEFNVSQVKSHFQKIQIDSNFVYDKGSRSSTKSLLHFHLMTHS